MMEFLVYLSPIGNQIVRDLVSAKFKLRENYGYCSNPNIYGYSEENKNFVICTRNIKNGSNDVSDQVERTIFHEATHAAQVCIGYVPIGIPKSSMYLPWNLKQDVKNSLSAFNNSPNSKYYNMEYEAYWMQDKPKKVHYYLNKFCVK